MLQLSQVVSLRSLPRTSMDKTVRRPSYRQLVLLHRATSCRIGLWEASTTGDDLFNQLERSGMHKSTHLFLCRL